MPLIALFIVLVAPWTELMCPVNPTENNRLS